MPASRKIEPKLRSIRKWGERFKKSSKCIPVSSLNSEECSTCLQKCPSLWWETSKYIQPYAIRRRETRVSLKTSWYGLDAHDVRTVVKEFDLGPDEIRGLSFRIFYNLSSDNFHLVVHSGKRIFDTNSPENIYDTNRNERVLHGDDDF